MRYNSARLCQSQQNSTKQKILINGFMARRNIFNFARMKEEKNRVALS